MEESSAPINEVYIKEEDVNDTEVSTSQEELLVNKKKDYIDIKHEPVNTDNANCALSLVSSHI